jgi:TRAP-type C4-dicarboxylate transport system permease small subunit
MTTGFAESSQATTALVVSILGIVCCGVLAPVGWYVGQQELSAIDSGRRDPTNRGTANAARVIGIIFTLLYGGAFLFYIVAIFAVRVGA